MSTKIGSEFSDVMARLSAGKKLEETSRKDVPMFGDETYRKFDLDGDGKIDARSVESTKLGVTRREVTFVDAQGRDVDTFTSGTKTDSFFGLVETNKVWSHTHRERDAAGRLTETYERASNKTGELKERVTTVLDGFRTVSMRVEADRDDNGSFETAYNVDPTTLR